jgi:CHAT domain-containing protein/Tfp pilus assembly protein PilF
MKGQAGELETYGLHYDCVLKRRWGIEMCARSYFKRICLILAAVSALSFSFLAPSSAQLDEADALNKRVIELYQAGKYADATPLAERALAIREKALGPDDPTVARDLNNLALLLQATNRLTEAEPLFHRALTIIEKSYGPDHPIVATGLNNLAELLRATNRLTDAEPLYRRALKIFEKSYGPDHPTVATNLNNLALLLQATNRLAEAEPLMRRALAIHETSSGPDHPAVAIDLNNLALLLQTTGRLAEAEPLYRRALIIDERSYGPDHPTVARDLNNLALLLQATNRLAEAEPLFRRALTIQEKSYGPNHPTVATDLNNLAELLRATNRLADAEPLYRRALAIDENSYGPDHPTVAIDLNNLALLLQATNRPTEAEPLFHRALAIDEKSYGPDHPDVARDLNNLAELLRATNRLADAEPLYRRALKIFEKSYGPDHPTVATNLNNLALLLQTTNRLADALPLVRRLISEGRAVKWIALSLLLESRGDRFIEPLQAFSGSYEVVQRVSASAAGEAVSKLAARFAAGTGELADLVRKDQDLTVEAEQLDKAILTAVSKPPAERNAAEEDRIRERVDVIKSERDQLQQVFKQRFPNYAALSKPQLVSLQDTQVLLANDEALIVFDFDAKSYVWIISKTKADWLELPITVQDLAAQIATLRKPMSVDEDKPETEPFDTGLAYKIYQSTFGVVADKIAGKKRLSVVTNGALTGLPPQLLVTKDPTGKKLKEVDWLVRSYAITILPSVTSLQVLRGGSANSSAMKPMTAYADPVFSKKAREQAQLQQQFADNRAITRFYRGTQLDTAELAERLPPLPGTRKEVETIGKALKIAASDIYLGLDATETAVKKAKLDQYKIVYFATHGLVAGDIEQFTKTKAEPALALTMPDKPTELDDGLLQASEVAQLKLNADWVVLSACNTAAEDRPGAEALSGLARAFFYAGARSLIVSHWPVDDLTTAQLMSAAFKLHNRRSDLSHAEVLQQAILQLINEAQTDDAAHPRFWAPFVVVGEPAKLTK